MQKEQLRFGEEGEPSLLVVHVPSDLEPRSVFALPILSREGGLLLAVPVASFASNALDAGQREDENSVLGPSFVTGASMVEESETGEIVAVDSYPIDVLLIDVADSFLGAVTDYDPAGDAGADIMPFDEEYPCCFASHLGFGDSCKELDCYRS